MDMSDTQHPRKDANPTGYRGPGEDDRKEVAWAFVGLLLWSGVVLGGVFGAGYILGHSILHLW